MNENENNVLNPQVPDPQAPNPNPAPNPAPIPNPNPAPAPAPIPAPIPEPQPEPVWEKPVPQLTLEPDPEPPVTNFTTPQPPRAPEPPQPEPPVADTVQQPQVQNQYVYNFNTVPTPDQGYQQTQNPQDPQQDPGQYQYNPPGYQPPNYTAQSYQPQPQQQPKYTTPPVGYQQKSRLAAGLLAIILGSLGIHNFYMGYNTRGTIQLVLCLAGGLLTCGVASMAAMIWGFIEGVMLLSSNNVRFDGNGVIMKD